MFRRTSIAIVAAALALCGQVNSIGSETRLTIFPPPPAAFDELKQHLGLTDTQVELLRNIVAEKYEATQEIYRQINQKRMELDTLLRSGSRDAARIGQLTIDIHILSTQPPPPTDVWRQRALAVLTPDQRTKLGPLEQAMKLSTPAYQAVTLDLIDPPPPGPPRILATDARELPPVPAPGTPVSLPAPLP
jgi:Spy/CpxP family protein refolding chaperone